MSNTSIKTHFDKLAPVYDEYKKRNRLYYDALKNTVKSLITKNKNRILDIGCGTGSILAFLNPDKGIGIDVSRKMIKQAQFKYKSNRRLQFVTHNIEKAPFRGEFDYVLLLDVIEHLKDKKQAIENITRTMNDKSVLILSMVNPFFEPLLMLLERLHLKMPEGPHVRIGERELSAILLKYHLSISKKVTALLGLIFVYKINKP
jgi:2-polyprenyl-3-methyl-5-hydroxy-6-metoxy-1,4-benzoquinol methylase